MTPATPALDFPSSAPAPHAIPEATPPTPSRTDSGAFSASVPIPRLTELAVAAVASLISRDLTASGTPETAHLQRHLASVPEAAGFLDRAIVRVRNRPHPQDEPLVRLAAHLNLTDLEVLAVALAVAVEQDPMTGRALAYVQAPIGGSRPLAGLIAAAFAPVTAEVPVMATLLNGAAVRTGLLVLLNEGVPLPERPMMVPPPLCLAMAGHDVPWPGTRVGVEPELVVPLPATVRRQSVEHAAALLAPGASGLLIRAASLAESRSTAAAIAEAMELRPAFVEGDKLSGLGPWLRLRRLLPVFVYDLAPGDRQALPEIPGYTGPRLALAGPEGAVECRSGTLVTWTLPVPDLSEREALWRSALAPGSPELANSNAHRTLALAHELARHHRHRTGRIVQLARLARHHAALADRQSPTAADLAAAAWSSEGTSLETLAEPLRLQVPDEALVAPRSLRHHLDLLILRCRHRDGLVDALGPAAAVRYRTGVRTLFTGPSGTGKTLAAGWLATRLGLPLYRVDLAGVTSKYIGETEKNLARLLAIAERDDVILLFDEADSLFGKRTDIRDSNDRFANAQTNYLLQRIENYDGIVVLTSNSKARFDSAFARRLDFVLDFPLPGPEERRALWLAHLGSHHSLLPADLNRLAALADLAGGHIRNAVLVAALLARAAHRPVSLADCLRGLESEYRKLVRQVPSELRQVTAAEGD